MFYVEKGKKFVVMILYNLFADASAYDHLLFIHVKKVILF
jgi:hypothetical protein